MAIKYFFGYHKHGGLWWPITWPEEGGIPIGARPNEHTGVVEITPDEFNLTLSELVRKYPRKGDDVLSQETG